MAASAAQRMTRMSPTGRRMVRVIGVLLAVAGAALLALSFATFLQLAPEAIDGEGEPTRITGGMTALIVYLILGAILLLAGVFCLRLGFLKPVPLGYDDEADPAAGTAAEARLPCTVCGNLERATAKHCSECGSSL